MNLLPKASGARPRVACDISPQGVVAATSALPGGPLTAVARVALEPGAIVPSLKPGNIADRVAVSAAVRSALENIGQRPNSRGANITLVLPDGAVRVLLLEFDSFPNKLTEALPIVRFRLKKMLPFDADDAMVTFQIMSTSKQMVRVLAVAIPRDVLSEYETAAREAGFEPGAVLPSTLASLAALGEEDPALLVNANDLGVTAAIVRSGILLLHRSVDLAPQPVATPANIPPAMFEPSSPEFLPVDEFAHALPLVDLHDTAHEWAAQQPLPEHGRDPYADRIATETAVQDENSLPNYRIPDMYASDAAEPPSGAPEPGNLAYSPYLSPTLNADLSAEYHNAILIAPTSVGTLTEDRSGQYIPEIGGAELNHEPPPVSPQDGIPAQFAAAALHEPIAIGEEIAQAISVAVAYFEDTLAVAPSRILSAGPLGADVLGRILSDYGLAQADGLRVRELVEPAALAADALTASVPRGWLAGVTGALRS